MLAISCTRLYNSLYFKCLHERVGGEGLGPLDGEAEGTGPDKLGQHSQGAGHSEQHGVVVHLLHAVILKQINNLY